MQILQTNSFKKAVKKLHANQKSDLDQAVRDIISNPTLGDAKIGDLAGVFVYKFKMAKQLTLLAYSYEDQTITLTLLALGSHENFYRDLKQN
ncbi:type II toxin-antitoxin system RelE/ParE family toxin [Bartonella queenslandensis]|uniref:type II toxin-antitoxin system RelE/ParE family toxin n=1 Tax=Bartonella queenslandensis TaxID=481138 RepID=UPI0002ED8B2D|nr:type II toxin-antitoxin system RelE/ParE family toxin [Bartonella queenslandensis]